jgi:predicted RNA-binding protein with PUA-like domain
MKYWLLKSEPDEFSIDALQRVGVEPWSGVRNYQARNHLREMKVGDKLLFYHSSCEAPGVVGIAKVERAAFADPTQFDPRSDYHDPNSDPADPRWSAVDVAFERKLKRTITLEELRGRGKELGDFALIRRGNRLSVLPVSAPQWKIILAME